MRRCTYCFRFHPGSPTFCSHCGRSFNVRICSRGHHNPRGVTFCADCGSADLSTPAPPPAFLHWFSGVALYGLVSIFVGVVVVSLVLSFLNSIDWNLIGGPLVLLAIMLGVLYWTTTLLPGPVKKVGKAAGKLAWKAVKGTRKK
jgi:hypothetical protein